MLSDQIRERFQTTESPTVRDVFHSVLLDEAIDPELLANVIARMTGVPRIKLQSLPAIRPEVFAILPENVIRDHGVVPLGFLSPEVVAVGVLNPLDREALALTSFFTGARVQPLLLSPTDLAAEYERRFRRQWVVPWQDLADRALRLSSPRSKMEFNSMTDAPLTDPNAQLMPTDEPLDDGPGNRIGVEAIARLTRSMGSEVRSLRLPTVVGEGGVLPGGQRMRPVHAVEHGDDGFEFSNTIPTSNTLKYAFGARKTDVTALKLSIDGSDEPAGELLGYTGSPNTLLDRTRERDSAATQVFQLVAERLEASPDGQPRIDACLDDLLLIYTTVIVARFCTTGLNVVHVKSTLRNVRSEIGRVFPVTRDSVWEMVLTNHVAYRGTLGEDDPLSEHLRRIGEVETWAVPLCCERRVVGVILMTCDSNKRMRLPMTEHGLKAFEALGQALGTDVVRSMLESETRS